MDDLVQRIAHVALIGIGATAAMDAWLLLQKWMGVPTLDFALVGRWVGHWRRGRWAHDSIAKAQPISHERALGWLVHYLTGVAFAGLLVALYGPAWAHSPSLSPALLVGIGTVAAPWLLMQPAMGAGIASSRTPAPAKNRLRSVVNHAMFGTGLYLSASLIAWVTR